ncbi:hypothetical protein J6590_068470 [Homalodisca vitripennis]|nr:hypothetical protein J6590_068470 [Homalodisca vitripennis]
MKVSPIIPQRGVGCLRLTTARWLEVEAAALLCVGSGNCEHADRNPMDQLASSPGGHPAFLKWRPPSYKSLALLCLTARPCVGDLKLISQFCGDCIEYIQLLIADMILISSDEHDTDSRSQVCDSVRYQTPH